jgi:hypothetical protein
MSFIMLCFVAAVYFAPAIVGMVRHKANAGAIFALNLCLGWTILGWVGALVWALTMEDSEHDKRITRLEDRK